MPAATTYTLTGPSTAQKAVPSDLYVVSLAAAGVNPDLVLATSAARTATFTGPTVDRGPVSPGNQTPAGSLVVDVVVTAVKTSAGNETYALKTQASVDGTTWADVGSGTATVTGTVTLTGNVTAVQRYVRVVATLGGTSPSITFAASTADVTLADSVVITPASNSDAEFRPARVRLSQTRRSAGFQMVAGTSATHAVSTTNAASLNNPAAVNTVVAASPLKTVTLSWSAVSNATAYDVYFDGEYVGGTHGLKYVHRLGNGLNFRGSYRVVAYTLVSGLKRQLAGGNIDQTITQDATTLTVPLA